MYQKWLRAGAIRFIAMTGYNVAIFNELLPYFEEAHNTYFSRYDVSGKKKKEFRKFTLFTKANSPIIGSENSKINAGKTGIN